MSPITNALQRQTDYLRFFTVGSRRAFVGLCLSSFLGALAEGAGYSVFIPLILATGGAGSEQMPGGTGALLRTVQAGFAACGLAMTFENTLLLMAAVFTGRGALRFVDGLLRARLSARFAQRLQRELYDLTTSLRLGDFLRRSRGELSSLFTADLNASRLSFTTFQAAIVNLLMTGTFGALALAGNYSLVGIAAVMGGLLFGFQRLLLRRAARHSLAASVSNQKLNGFFLQTLGSFKYLKGSHAFAPLRMHVLRQSQAGGEQLRTGQVFGAISESFQQPFLVLVFVVLLLWSVRVQNIPVAAAITSLVLIHRMVQAWGYFLNDFNAYAVNRGSVDNLMRHLTELGRDGESDAGRAPAIFAASLELRDVNLSLGGNSVLTGLGLRLLAGTSLGILGRSGSGKSTLMDVVTGLHRPDTGAVLLDGRDLRTIDLGSWRGQIGIVSQDVPLFDDTIFNNVSLWNRAEQETPAAEAAVWESLRLALADEFVRRLPFGLQTTVGEKGVTLSGGQRQRLAIARELFKHPKLLLLDEATSALDADSESAIQETLRALRGRFTMILSAHRLATLRICDELVVMDAGKIIEQGSFDALYANPESHFRRLWDKQAAPAAPSSRFKVDTREWQLILDLDGGPLRAKLDNLSETGLAIHHAPELAGSPANAEFRGTMQHRDFTGPVRMKLVHRYGDLVGFVFTEVAEPVRFAISDFIKQQATVRHPA